MMLRMENIQKRFFGKYANRNVNLNVEAGEIHALLGENGAGKTMETLFHSPMVIISILD